VQSYILRIYRRRKDHPQDLVGLVQKAGMEGMRAFHSFEELRQILHASDATFIPVGEDGVRKTKKRQE